MAQTGIKQKLSIPETPKGDIPDKPKEIGDVLTSLGHNPKKPGLGLAQDIIDSKEESPKVPEETNKLS